MTKQISPLRQRMIDDMNFHIGLTNPQAEAVDRYRDTLRNQQSSLESELTGDDIIFAPETPDAINAKVSRYADQLRAARADTIARTESMRVVSDAQDEALRQAFDATGISGQLV